MQYQHTPLKDLSGRELAALTRRLADPPRQGDAAQDADDVAQDLAVWAINHPQGTVRDLKRRAYHLRFTPIDKGIRGLASATRARRVAEALTEIDGTPPTAEELARTLLASKQDPDLAKEALMGDVQVLSLDQQVKQLPDQGVDDSELTQAQRGYLRRLVEEAKTRGASQFFIEQTNCLLNGDVDDMRVDDPRVVRYVLPRLAEAAEVAGKVPS